MTSAFKTKNGSSLDAKIDLERAKGPAVPKGSSSCEKVIVIPNLLASTES